MAKRWTYKWIDQNRIEVNDSEEDRTFYMLGDVLVLDLYDTLPQDDANLFFSGFLAGVEYCDARLKHCLHNFIEED